MSSLSQLSERVGGGKAKFAIIVAITCLAAAVASQWSAARYKLAVRGPDNSTTVVDFSRLRSASAIDLRTLLDEPVEAGAAAKQLIVFVSGVECGGCLTEAGSWEHAAEVSDPAKLQVTIVVVRATEEEARSFARLFSRRVRILFDRSRRLERIILAWKLHSR